MRTINNNNNNNIKRQYLTPVVERIELDNEIALQLESAPPEGPGEQPMGKMPEYFNSNPFTENFA